MANIRVIQSPYIGPFSNIEQVNEAPASSTTAPYGVGTHVGELGGRVELTQTGSGTKEYQKVQLDSGTAVAYATGQLLYWKNKASYIVTADAVQAIGGQSANSAFRNEVAGVLTVTSPTAGNYTWIQQKGNNTVLKSKSLTGVAGYQLVSDTTTAQADIVAAGTAITVVAIGKNNSVGAALTTLNCDLDIPGIP